MGLLDSLFNTQEPQAMQGLLGDPTELRNRANTTGLVNMALGYLAAPKHSNLGLGRILAGSYVAGQQGAQGTYDNALQDYQTKTAMDMKQKQFDMTNKQFDMTTQKFNQETTQFDDMQKAIADASALHPDLAPLFKLDPKAAIKVLYPQANSADPYFTPISTSTGLGSFNNRDGKFTMVQGANGQPIIKAVDSPQLQGSIAGAKAEGGAQWKPNNDIPGVISTDAKVSAEAMGVPLSNFNVPYPMKWNGKTMGAPNTTMTDRLEGDGSVEVRNPAQPNKPVPLGIKVPTKDEQAALTKSAEMKAEANTQAQITLPNTIATAENTIKQLNQLIGTQDGKMKPHKGFETAVGFSSKIDPRNYLAGTDATDFNIRLDQLKGGQFLQAFEGLKGGGSITEIEGKKATDAIARMNTAGSEAEFIKAANDYRDVVKAGINRSKLKAGLTNKNIADKTNQVPNEDAGYAAWKANKYGK